uniref:(northern house mosquito) hypothetical protein n=1 Tax=Culex pipiens TaxID=7175 RepID=A0A8D8BPZ3_CULPI
MTTRRTVGCWKNLAVGSTSCPSTTGIPDGPGWVAVAGADGPVEEPLAAAAVATALADLVSSCDLFLASPLEAREVAPKVRSVEPSAGVDDGNSRRTPLLLAGPC